MMWGFEGEQVWAEGTTIGFCLYEMNGVLGSKCMGQSVVAAFDLAS